MDTNSWTPGWYQLPTDPDGTVRYHDGTSWTDHVSTTEPASGDAGRSRRTQRPLLIAAAVIVVGALGMAAATALPLRSHGARLDPAHAVDGLPSAAQVSTATGIAFGPATRDTRIQSGIDDNGSCTVPGDGAEPAPPQGEGNESLSAGGARAANSVFAFDDTGQAQRYADRLRSYLANNRVCVLTGGDQLPPGANVQADGRTSVASTATNGSGIGVDVTGNAVVLVVVANPAGAVLPQQVDQYLQVALDAAEHPDAGRH